MTARVKTLRHIETVRNYLNTVVRELLHRQEQHDQSKLESPEAEAFEVITDGLRGLTYGSQEYFEVLKSQEPAIAHHYKHNQHHPEFWARGIHDMSLIDLIEMLCDWRAATLRHWNGDIFKSIEFNQARFGYSDELKGILVNTAQWLIQQDVFHKADES